MRRNYHLTLIHHPPNRPPSAFWSRKEEGKTASASMSLLCINWHWAVCWSFPFFFPPNFWPPNWEAMISPKNPGPRVPWFQDLLASSGHLFCLPIQKALHLGSLLSGLCSIWLGRSYRRLLPLPSPRPTSWQPRYSPWVPFFIWWFFNN